MCPLDAVRGILSLHAQSQYHGHQSESTTPWLWCMFCGLLLFAWWCFLHCMKSFMFPMNASHSPSFLYLLLHHVLSLWRLFLTLFHCGTLCVCIMLSWFQYHHCFVWAPLCIFLTHSDVWIHIIILCTSKLSFYTSLLNTLPFFLLTCALCLSLSSVSSCFIRTAWVWHVWDSLCGSWHLWLLGKHNWRVVHKMDAVRQLLSFHA